jgi:hypothetical protein
MKPKPPTRIMPFAPSLIPSSVPPPTPNSNQMMGYPQQGGWGMGSMGGMGGMGQMGGNPYMMQQGHPQLGGSMAQSQVQGQMGQGAGSGTGTGASITHLDANGNELKPFDSAQMKQGRMGHYGYLEGRGMCLLTSVKRDADSSELAGPPVGYLPAGMQPPGPVSPSQGRSNISPGSANPMSGAGPVHPTGSIAGSGQYSQSGASGSMWGEGGNMPRARYDGGKSHSLLTG